MSRYGMAGFDGAEPDLAIGFVTGVRWWDLTGTALKGVHGEWVIGENAARCGRYTRHGTDPHPVPDEDCGCGFWAYWTTSAAGNPHGFDLPVLGVVEGYGKTLIGERGFRCAKARIIALHIPAVSSAREMRNLDAPEFLRKRGNGAVDTWRALCGHRSGPWKLDPADALARGAVLEFQVEERYGVPVYSTAALMLNKHPPTPDYLPRQDQPAVLPAKPSLTVAEALALMVAKAQPSSAE